NAIAAAIHVRTHRSQHVFFTNLHKMAKLLVLAACTSALVQQPARRISRRAIKVQAPNAIDAMLLTPRMGVVKPGDFKNGLTIERDGGVWKVLNFQQTKTARQAAMVRTKLKNLVSGTTVEDTFRMSETFQTAQVDTNDAVYSYDDGDSLVFMDAVDFDEITIPRESIENIDLVKDGMTVQIVKWGDTIVDVQLPTSETYEVTYTEPGLKNAASTGQSKDATLETGAVIQVPLFVEIGDVVKVKCAEREFIERAKK
ncbi:unnamed protein product, partial [Pelagomonas calceolata]